MEPPKATLMTTSLSSPTARKLLEDLDAELVSLYPDHPYPPPFGDEEALPSKDTAMPCAPLYGPPGSQSSPSTVTATWGQSSDTLLRV